MTTPDTPALSSSASLDIPAIPPPSSAGASYEEQNVAAPVRLDERIQALDTIRGFALLGILLRPGGTAEGFRLGVLAASTLSFRLRLPAQTVDATPSLISSAKNRCPGLYSN